jgi:hypothetical protein
VAPPGELAGWFPPAFGLVSRPPPDSGTANAYGRPRQATTWLPENPEVRTSWDGTGEWSVRPRGRPGPTAADRLAQRGAIPPWSRPQAVRHRMPAPIGGYFPLYTNCAGPTNNFHAVMSGRDAEMRLQLAVESNAANVSKRSIERVIPMTDGEVGAGDAESEFLPPPLGVSQPCTHCQGEYTEGFPASG